MTKGIDLNETVKYTLTADKDEPKTVWLLSSLDTRINKFLQDQSFSFEQTPDAAGENKARVFSNLGKIELDLIAFGLRGFENFNKSDGKQIYFETEARIVNGKTYQVLAENILKIIPGAAITELAKKIKELNEVGAEASKN